MTLLFQWAILTAAFVTPTHRGLLSRPITMAPSPLYGSYLGRTGRWLPRACRRP
jgi:hypothetical protein